MSFIKPILLAVLITVIVTVPAWGQDTDGYSDEDAIRAVFAEMEAAVADRDAARVASLHIQDSDVWIAGQPLISGIDAIRRSEEDFYATPGFQSWGITSVGAIRFIDDNVAIVNIEEVARFTDQDMKGETTVVLTRRDGRWLFAAVRAMQLLPLPKE